MKKIMLALNSENLGEILQDQLTGIFDIVFCQDADEAVDLLGTYGPDVIVLDLMLGGMDSFSILQAARDTGVCTKVIALSNYVGPYTAAMLEKFQVLHFVRLPCDSIQLAGRIVDAAFWEDESEQAYNRMRNTLVTLGFKMNTQAYRIIECAVKVYMQDPGQPLTAQLYPAVAEMCGGSTTQVEKAIRTGVESAWKHGNEHIWRLYFGTGKNGKEAKPSNGDFLARIALCLLEKEENKGEIRKKIG